MSAPNAGTRCILQIPAVRSTGWLSVMQASFQEAARHMADAPRGSDASVVVHPMNFSSPEPFKATLEDSAAWGSTPRSLSS